MAGVNDSELLRFEGWPQGINNRAAEEAVPFGALRAAKNIDLDDAGKPRRRPGATPCTDRAGLHSLWATDRFPFMLGVDETGMVAFDPSEDAEAVGPTLQQPTLPMSWAYGARRVFASNGVDACELLEDLSHRPWAVEHPGGQPLVAVSPSAGGLAPGIYQVAITFLDVDGRESGATLPTEIEVAQGQGITLSNFPPAGDVRTALVRVYCSKPDGDQLYRVQELPVGLSSFLLGAHTSGEQLKTLFLSTMPACSIVRVVGNRLFGARDRRILWSEPGYYGLTRAATNHTHHDGAVTLIEPAGPLETDGLYTATAAAPGKRAGRTYFLTSQDPSKWARIVAHPQGAVPGSSTQFPAEALGVQAPGLVPVWLTDNGQFCVGLPGGQVIQLHAERYAAPAGVEHASIALREIGGMRHLIATLRGGQVSGMAAVDVAEAEVWKNGERIS